MKFYLVFLLLLLGGCATQVPDTIRLDLGKPIAVGQAQKTPAEVQGERVRWGGEILAVFNRPDFSELVVLRRPLLADGEPRPDGGEAKRFLARMNGFIDPAEYAKGKRLTVVGRLQGIRELRVGEYPYPHPLLRVEDAHLWPKYRPAPEPAWHRDPFYCDPFWPWGHRRPYCW